MSLNIKSERVHDLAREAARVSGKSLTGAVEEALERLLRDYAADPERVAVARGLHGVRGVVDAYLAAPAAVQVEVERAEDLYDATTGLPR